VKKVLYIAYYWPPCGGISVLRNSKLAKYFPQYGWDPVIYAPENPHYPVIDPSTEADIPKGTVVLKQPVLEPFGVFNLLQGKKAKDKVQDVFLVRDKKPGLMHSLGVWVRGNFFIPDARMLWIKPSVKYLVKYLRENPVDAILSSGPPHTVHRIALGVKKQTGLPWIADFQDPWTQIDYFEKFMLTPFARNKHYRQEREVLQTADKVVTVSPSWAKDFEMLSGREAVSIPMGFDADDFTSIPPKSDKFIISHFGTLGIDRNPEQLWTVLADLCQELPDFGNDLQIDLAGVIDYSVFEAIEKAGLQDKLHYERFLNRAEVIARMQASAVLLLLLNKGFGNYNVMGRIPAKLFEYLGAKQPVLVLGLPGSDVDKIIHETQAGVTVNYNDSSAIKESILTLYDAWKKGLQLYRPVNTEKYSFRWLTGEMARLLDEISK
jgi:hypothetical protein